MNLPVLALTPIVLNVSMETFGLSVSMGEPHLEQLALNLKLARAP